MSRINEIVKRRDEAARSTSEKGWIHAQVPTWDDIDYLLSLVKDGGVGDAQVNLQCPANKGTTDGQWYICTVPLKVETVIITPGHDGPHNFVPVESRATAPTETSARCGECESPILAFEAWLLRWVQDNGRRLTQTEYGIAYAAFIAAHPGEGPQAHVMSTVFPASTEVAGERLSGLNAAPRLSHQEDASMTKNYDGFRAGMLRAAEMVRDEFKRAPEAAKGHDCVWMGGYESACDHLSIIIAQAAVIDCVRIAGAQPDWQYHISLLLPDGGVEDRALLKIYQVVEHEISTARADAIQECAMLIKGGSDGVGGDWTVDEATTALEQLKGEGSGG